MCGQFGIVTKSANFNADDFMTDAYVTSQLRGVDSSGIATINTDKNTYYLHKLPVAGSFFVNDRVAKRYINQLTSPRVIGMGHVRAATSGIVSISNAHPFEIDDEGSDILVGTHNGTLTGWSTRRGGKHFDVDSEWALWRITIDGLEAFKDFTGAYSFVWWTGADKDTLCMARNKERPMAIAFLKEGGMAYASEPGMLFWLLERNNLPIDGDILITDVDKLYKFPVGSPKDFTTEDLPKAQLYVNTSTNNYSQNRNYNYTTVDRVQTLLSQLSATPLVADTATDEFQFPLAFESEIKLAREYGWYDTDVEFTPMGVNTEGNTFGLACYESTDFDAIIRGDYRGQLDYEGLWKCYVLGAQEDEKEVGLVLSKPVKIVSSLPEET